MNQLPVVHGLCEILLMFFLMVFTVVQWRQTVHNMYVHTVVNAELCFMQITMGHIMKGYVETV